MHDRECVDVAAWGMKCRQEVSAEAVSEVEEDSDNPSTTEKQALACFS